MFKLFMRVYVCKRLTSSSEWLVAAMRMRKKMLWDTK